MLSVVLTSEWPNRLWIYRAFTLYSLISKDAWECLKPFGWMYLTPARLEYFKIWSLILRLRYGTPSGDRMNGILSTFSCLSFHSLRTFRVLSSSPIVRRELSVFSLLRRSQFSRFISVSYTHLTLPTILLV